MTTLPIIRVSFLFCAIIVMTCNIDAQQYTDYSEILVKISSEKQSDALEKLLEGRSLNIKQLFKKKQ